MPIRAEEMIEVTETSNGDNNLKENFNPLTDAQPNVLEPNNERLSQTMIRASTIMQLKRNAGLIKIVGAPSIDLAQAKQQLMDDSSLAESPEMAELSHYLSSAGMKERENSNDFANLGNIENGEDGANNDPECLDTANEETFTLETFESLIRAARSAGKTFILARVTTVDPKNLTRLYYSYYSAYQINKVIFRTQPEEGLLHRMKSRNPLNNMLIVGDVHYLTISPEEFDRAWAQQQQCLSPIQKASSISTNSPVSSVVIDPTSKTSLVSNHNVSGTPKVIVYEASFYATDDDFLMRTEIREFFRRNSVNPDDYQLFQLHRRSNHPYEMTILGPDGRPLFDRSQAAPDQHNHPRAGRLRTLCGLLDGGYHRNLVGFHTGYLSPLGFWVLMLALTGSTVSCALLLFPPYMQYVALGSLLGVFCILLLFFVDWTDGQRP